jgi:manganese/zinc/iron transport system substrate-binding protein
LQKRQANGAKKRLNSFAIDEPLPSAYILLIKIVLLVDKKLADTASNGVPMKLLTRELVFLVGALAGWLPMLGGCSAGSNAQNGSVAQHYPIKISCTVGMVADVVREIGGEHVAVTQLMGPGVDPHLHKTTYDDISALASADLVIYSGLMLEGKMTDVFVRIGRSKPVYAITERLGEKDLLEPEDFAGHYDPHVWMDVSLWAKCAADVGKILSEFDPPHAADYRERTDAYVAQLKALDEYGKRVLATIPKESRVLITSHDAFNYFGRAYGLEVQGVQGISTESEAGLQRINELVDLLVARKVKAVFVESSVPRKNIQALVEGTKSRGHEVTIGGELFSDAMGAAGTYEGTYIGMLDHNITTVTRALGGKAPARGLNGKLAE